jgi:hypothetical protein
MNPSFDPSQLPLRDIHLPSEIAWWPFAFGWWLLAGMALALALVASVKYWRGRRNRAARRSLYTIMAELNSGAEPARCAQQASVVLRRFAMTVARETPDVAGLAGARWAQYLAGRGAGVAFEPDDGSSLLDLPYAVPEHVSVDEATALCRACLAWVDAQPARA